MTDVRVKVKLQSTERFFDRVIAKQLDPAMNRYLRWAGRDIRRAARRLLKVKRLKVGELSPEQLVRHRRLQFRYKAGLSPLKPQLPKAHARKGEPPALQFKPNPLRDGTKGILFSLDDSGTGVVVGPSPFGDNDAQKIEARHPFMVPALEKVTPRLPGLLDRATAA